MTGRRVSRVWTPRAGGEMSDRMWLGWPVFRQLTGGDKNGLTAGDAANELVRAYEGQDQ
jgi:hypothetical protein